MFHQLLSAEGLDYTVAINVGLSYHLALACELLVEVRRPVKVHQQPWSSQDRNASLGHLNPSCLPAPFFRQLNHDRVH